MLTEQRYDIILKLLEEKNSITVAEVKELLNTSESTVRRDITALHNAGKLVKGFRVYLVGGELKGSTEAVVGNQALVNLQSYHFTKGFFGTNGISRQNGLTTPDMNEAMVKKTAMGQCRECFILADHSKFGNVSSVTFGSFQGGTILTDSCPQEYKNSSNVIICG